MMTKLENIYDNAGQIKNIIKRVIKNNYKNSTNVENIKRYTILQILL